MEKARLNAARGIGDHLTDPRMKSALTRMFANAEPAITKLETLHAQAQRAGSGTQRHLDPDRTSAAPDRL